jgi:hypothetical protein
MLETLVEHIGVVFGTNSLFPGNESAPVGEIPGPFRGEDIWIIDRDLDLQAPLLTGVKRPVSFFSSRTA